ncbi:MAG: NAD(P)-binding protein [Alcaligenaceae bacterium]|nr:NAD(P)-binding protein [Alcaligenaceae bacterium]
MSGEKILISGAGIGGLTAALALLRKGFEVQVLEQASELKEVGAGLQLSPNVLRALFNLGLEQALKAVAVAPMGKEIRLWNTGQTWKLFDLGADCLERYGYPYFMIYRPDLHRVLYQAVEQQQPGVIVLGARVKSVTQEGDAVLATTEDGPSYRGQAMIAADGVHSPIRNQHFGEDRAEFSGCMAWRGVIPVDKLPAHLRRNAGVNWVGPGGHVINYTLHGGELMNFVGILERDDWTVESWTSEGSHEECHNDFAGWHDDIHSMIANIDIPFKWALMGRRPLEKWVKGRIALLGDAAHPTLPFLAQGAGMAIEDGYVIADALAQNGSVEKALQAFERARLERCTQIVEKSTENGRRFHNPELANATGAAAYVSREWTPAKVKERYDWLFRYNVEQALMEKAA